MTRLLASGALLAGLLLAAMPCPVSAEDLNGANNTAPPAVTDAPDVLSGTLKKIRDAGTVTIGYREASFPFSYVRNGGPPMGYSIDLCLGIVDQIKRELAGAPIAISYQLVTADT